MSINPYWLKPTKENEPTRYAADTERQSARSEFLADLLEETVPAGEAVLEVGCNAGRNLEHLRRRDRWSLRGVELNPDAVALMQESFPETYESATIEVGDAAEVLRGRPSRDVHTIFTMAVLEHVPDEDICVEIARVASDQIVTIEDEVTSSPRHYPRRYDRVFRKLGFRQTRVYKSVPGATAHFRCRVFTRDPRSERRR